MDNMSFKEFFPLAPALVIAIGWLVGYLVSRKLKHKEEFFKKTEENIQNILGPLVMELNLIFREKHMQSQSRLIEKFVNKYNGIESPLFLSTSGKMIYYFNFFLEDYYKFKEAPSVETHDLMWKSLFHLNENAQKQLDTYRDILFAHYDWYYKVELKNPIMKFLFSTFKNFYLMLTGLAQVTGLTLAFLLVERLMKLFNTPTVLYLWPFRGIIMFFSFMILFFWLLLFILNAIFFEYKIKRKLKYEKNIHLIKYYKSKFPIYFPKYAVYNHSESKMGIHKPDDELEAKNTKADTEKSE